MFPGNFYQMISISLILNKMSIDLKKIQVKTLIKKLRKKPIVFYSRGSHKGPDKLARGDSKYGWIYIWL